MGTRDMFSTPAPIATSHYPRAEMRFAAKWIACWSGPALAVDRRGGRHDTVIGSGVEHMGHIPMGVGFKWVDEVGSPWPPGDDRAGTTSCRRASPPR